MVNNSIVNTQYAAVSKMLSDSMLHHTSTILRQWINTLMPASGMQSPEGLRLQSLLRHYERIRREYLAEPESVRNTENSLVMSEIDDLTAEFYRLTDELYADMLLHDGIAPEMHGYNRENANSIVNYFAACPHLQDEDLDWFDSLVTEPEHSGTGLLVTAALGHNLRNVFSESAMYSLLRAARSEVPVVASQAMAHVILTLAHYDSRIDYFPDLREEFLSLDMSMAYQVLSGLVYGAKSKLRDLLTQEDFDEEELPDEIREAFSDDKDVSLDDLVKHLPEGENQYMVDMISFLPETWVFGVIIDSDDRREEIAELYVRLGMAEVAYDGICLGRLDLCTTPRLRAGMLLHEGLYEEALEAYQELEKMFPNDRKIGFKIGWCAMLAKQYDLAEEYMVERLRGKNPNLEDYINYAHLCMIRGDRMSAYEYYREARRQAGSLKRWKVSYCPDRKMLIEHGVPTDQVYLIEDLMVSI